MERNDDPFFEYSVEELQDMSHEEFCEKYNLKTLDEVMKKYGF